MSLKVLSNVIYFNLYILNISLQSLLPIPFGHPLIFIISCHYQFKSENGWYIIWFRTDYVNKFQIHKTNTHIPYITMDWVWVRKGISFPLFEFSALLIGALTWWKKTSRLCKGKALIQAENTSRERKLRKSRVPPLGAWVDEEKTSFYIVFFWGCLGG